MPDLRARDGGQFREQFAAEAKGTPPDQAATENGHCRENAGVSLPLGLIQHYGRLAYPPPYCRLLGGLTDYNNDTYPDKHAFDQATSAAGSTFQGPNALASDCPTAIESALDFLRRGDSLVEDPYTIRAVYLSRILYWLDLCNTAHGWGLPSLLKYPAGTTWQPTSDPAIGFDLNGSTWASRTFWNAWTQRMEAVFRDYLYSSPPTGPFWTGQPAYPDLYAFGTDYPNGNATISSPPDTWVSLRDLARFGRFDRDEFVSLFPLDVSPSMPWWKFFSFGKTTRGTSMADACAAWDAAPWGRDSGATQGREQMEGDGTADSYAVSAAFSGFLTYVGEGRTLRNKWGVQAGTHKGYCVLTTDGIPAGVNYFSLTANLSWMWVDYDPTVGIVPFDDPLALEVYAAISGGGLTTLFSDSPAIVNWSGNLGWGISSLQTASWDTLLNEACPSGKTSLAIVAYGTPFDPDPGVVIPTVGVPWQVGVGFTNQNTPIIGSPAYLPSGFTSADDPYWSFLFAASSGIPSRHPYGAVKFDRQMFGPQAFWETS